MLKPLAALVRPLPDRPSKELMTEISVHAANSGKTLFEAFADAATVQKASVPMVLDPSGETLSYRNLLRAAQILGRKLESLVAERDSVGVMLPNSVAVAVVFLALQSIARLLAMLNFTAGSETMVGCCRAAKLRVILTSRDFVAKAGLEAAVAHLEHEAKIVYLEDVRAQITLTDKLRGALQGPVARHAQLPEDPAVVLFTSGTEGAPKGVVLSHRNILANVAQALSRVEVSPKDKVFNVLPVFHSFGLTVGLIMPLMAGIPAFLYPSPLHYRIVPELIRQTRATILLGTNTFLAGYARAARPDALCSLSLIVAGAEPVQPQTRAVYRERFGVPILEGYGVTEAAPVVALNTPLANRSGTVGRLSPHMEARLEPVEGVADGGRLFVRGPNVMLGYLRSENPGVLEPPPGGWHDTGDIVTIDDDGYIAIKGRAKRFAKIAGEMVSLAAVDALAYELWPDAASAAVAVPDRRKGERLVLVTTARDARRGQMVRQAKKNGVSELFAPAEILTVDKLPTLGSGKPDYAAIRVLVENRRMQSAPSRTSGNLRGCDEEPDT